MEKLQVCSDLTLKEFLQKLGSGSPSPGGGCAAALSGAMGAALVSMVCNLTIGKEKYSEFQELIKNVLSKSDELTKKLIDCAQNDTTAFDSVIEAFKMPKNSENEKISRSKAIKEAYKSAAIPPEETAKNCLEVMRLAKSLLYKSNKNIASDLSIAAIQAYAGLIGAVENVEINLPKVNDEKYMNEKFSLMSKMKIESSELLKEIREGSMEMQK